MMFDDWGYEAGEIATEQDLNDDEARRFILCYLIEKAEWALDVLDEPKDDDL